MVANWASWEWFNSSRENGNIRSHHPGILFTNKWSKSDYSADACICKFSSVQCWLNQIITFSRNCALDDVHNRDRLTHQIISRAALLVLLTITFSLKHSLAPATKKSLWRSGGFDGNKLRQIWKINRRWKSQILWRNLLATLIVIINSWNFKRFSLFFLRPFLLMLSLFFLSLVFPSSFCFLFVSVSGRYPLTACFS